MISLDFVEILSHFPKNSIQLWEWKKKSSSPKNVSECEARDVNVTRVSVLKVHLQWNSSLAHDASWKSSKKLQEIERQRDLISNDNGTNDQFC